METFEIVMLRIAFLVYFIMAHIAMPFLDAIGLRIDYINHMPWQYKKMWKRFWNFNEYFE